MFQSITVSTHVKSSARRQVRGEQVAQSNRPGDSFWFAALRNLTLSFGLFAMLTLAYMYFNPDFADKFKALSPFGTESTPVTVQTETSTFGTLLDSSDKPVDSPAVRPQKITNAADDTHLLGNDKSQKWVTTWLAKRYRVATEAANMLVSAAYVTAREIKIDPLLILSVMAIESGFNPFAESPVGAQGLMQVMSKVHQDKFKEVDGTKSALNPAANIRVGAMILKEYVSRAGSVEGGLKMYVGAADAPTDFGYGQKVLSEYKRLKDVSSGKSVPTVFSATPAVSAPVKNERNDSSKPVLEDKDAIVALH